MTQSPHVSPLAPKTAPNLPPIEGVTLACSAAGVRYRGRTDVMLAILAPGTEAAGVFTRSKCPSAPVDWCRAQLKNGAEARALLVNSGNANAFTGKAGVASVEQSARIAAAALNISERSVFLASTGVIGEPLDASKFESVIAPMAQSARADAWLDASRAIMTTDTFPKIATAQARLGDAKVTINGMAKGAGMIAPDMATMLSFIFTDAPIASAALQTMLSEAVPSTFNAITVDSDTSTSDTLLIFATGAAVQRGAPRIEDSADSRLAEFKTALRALMLDLAQQVARDGEGARKFIAVEVQGAETDEAAKRIAFSIANSPLVKTAIAGEDANWGRVVMAVGKAGEKADRDSLSIWFCGVRVAHLGQRDANYDEKRVSELMKRDEIDIRVELEIGAGQAKVWTCDLTKEYVAINGDYRS